MRIERQVLFWLIASVAVIFAIWLLKGMLLPFVLGVLFAYGLNPVANFLERGGLPRIVASIVVVVGLVLLFIVLLVFLVPVLFQQMQQLAQALPGELERFKGVVEEFVRARAGSRAAEAQLFIDRAYASISNNWSGLAQVAATSLWTQGGALFYLVSLFLITPLVVFYLLVDWPAIVRKIDIWLPRAHAGRIRGLVSDVNVAVGAFVRGQGLVCLILGTFYAVGLSLAGLDYGLLIGALTGLMAFVPIVGWTLGTVVATILAVVQFWPDPMPVLLVVGVFLAGMGLDAGFLGPKIVGKKIGLHPVWLIFALFAFSYLFGVVGVLVAVPLAAAVGVLVRFALQVYLDSSVYSGDAGSVPGVEETPKGKA